MFDSLYPTVPAPLKETKPAAFLKLPMNTDEEGIAGVQSNRYAPVHVFVTVKEVAVPFQETPETA